MQPLSSPTFVRDLGTLYRLGSLAGLSDRELLDLFTSRADSAAQRAFEAIVERHGAMVLAVCRRVLDDEHRAEDAFQATFLVLAMRAGSIRDRDSLAPWLHGVAARISRRARVVVHRRRETPLAPERLASRVPTSGGDDADELRSVLDEEVGRLPARYRRPVVICYLEGKTQDEAARELGWSKGTVSGRLARAKDLLRARLTRRGFAPSAGLLGTMLLTENTAAAVPAGLAGRAVKMALGVLLGRPETIAVSGATVAMARGALRAMLLGKVKLTAVILLMLAGFATALAQSAARSKAKGARTPAPARSTAAATVARRTEPTLPEHARIRLGTARLRHEERVHSVAFSPDGRTLASAGLDGYVRFWDVGTGEPAANRPAIKEGVWAFSVTYSPDGNKLAIGRDGGLVQVWDLVGGKESFRLNKHTDRVVGLAFTPDGTCLATAADGDSRVRIWDLAARRQVSELDTGEDPQTRGAGPLAFSADGTHIAYGNSSRIGQGELVCIWDLAHPEERTRIAGAHRDGLIALSFTPDGRSLVTSGSDTRRIKDRNDVVEMVPQVRIWDVSTGRLRRTLETGDLTGMCAIALSRGGKILISAHNDRLLVWDLRSGTIIRRIPVDANNYARAVGCLALSRDGRTIAAAQGDNVVRLWSVADGKALFVEPRAHLGEVYTVALSTDARLVATGDEEGTIQLWDATRGEHIRTIEMGEKGRIYSIRFAPDGRILGAVAEYFSPSRGFQGLTRLWDVPGGALQHEFRVDARAVQFASSPDGRRVAIATSIDRHDRVQLPAGAKDAMHEIRVFDVATGEKGAEMRGHQAQIEALGFMPDGRTLVSAGADMTFRFWDVETGMMIRQFPINGHERVDQHGLGKPARLMAAVFSPDLTKAVSSGVLDDRFNIWDLSLDRVRRHTIRAPANLGATLAMTPDSRIFASASAVRFAPNGDDTTIRLWEMATGRELLRLQTGDRGVRSLAFSGDGRTLVSGMSDTTALVWDASAAYDALERP